jgi:hypothetical protein
MAEYFFEGFRYEWINFSGFRENGIKGCCFQEKNSHIHSLWTSPLEISGKIRWMSEVSLIILGAWRQIIQNLQNIIKFLSRNLILFKTGRFSLHTGNLCFGCSWIPVDS